MNYLKTALLITLLSSITQACHKREYWGIRGKGDITDQNRSVGTFDAILLKCSANVTYSQDSVYRVVVKAQPNIQNILRTEVKNGELVIDHSKNVWDHKNIEVIVYSPGMRSMKVSGSGNIIATGMVLSKNMYAGISGSGNIKLPILNAESAEAKISGSGNIEMLAGETQTANFSISGSGNINAEFMKSNVNSSHISGSGNIRLHATESLNARISGSGDIYYRGQPAMDVDISGTGKIRKI